MGKAKKDKNKAKKFEKQRQLAVAQKSKISRRRFLMGVGSAIVLTGAGTLLYNLTKNPTYAQALMNKDKRRKWVKGLVSNIVVPDYTSISYANEGEYQNLRDKHKGKIAKLEDTFAISIPEDEERIARGTKTEIYLSPGCFLDIYKDVPQTWNDLGIIIRNVVIEHEMLHADHFHHGIQEYNLEDFYNSDGTINKEIFISVSEILAHKKEFDGLLNKKEKATSQLFSEYLKTLPMLTLPYYNLIYGSDATKNIDETFISKLRNDLDPRKLFR